MLRRDGAKEPSDRRSTNDMSGRQQKNEWKKNSVKEKLKGK